jgi:hypothetical protein
VQVESQPKPLLRLADTEVWGSEGIGAALGQTVKSWQRGLADNTSTTHDSLVDIGEEVPPPAAAPTSRVELSKAIENMGVIQKIGR